MFIFGRKKQGLILNGFVRSWEDLVDITSNNTAVLAKSLKRAHGHTVWLCIANLIMMHDLYIVVKDKNQMKVRIGNLEREVAALKAGQEQESAYINVEEETE